MCKETHISFMENVENILREEKHLGVKVHPHPPPQAAFTGLVLHHSLKQIIKGDLQTILDFPI